MDLLVTLNGLEATVSTNARTVIPHSDLNATATFTKGSAEHETFLNAARSKDALLSLRGKANTSNPFVPAVQPGSKLDWDISTAPFASSRFNVINATTSPSSAKLSFLSPIIATNAKSSLYLEKDNLRHALSTTRVYVPWASETSAAANPLFAQERTDLKGNWLRGRRVFFGEIGCATCHTLRGEGTAFGPDLSNLVFRDRDSVLADILHPSATINPDHTGTVVALKNGTSVSGVIRSLSNEKVKLALPAGAETEFVRSDVTSIEPLKPSLMPEGLGERMTADQLEDLLTFLLLNPLEPAPITRPDPAKPAPRSLRELTAIIGSPTLTAETKPLNILLCAGPKDHGLDEHNYPLWLERWSHLLAFGENVSVKTSMGFPTAEQLAHADVAVFYNANPDWNAEKAATMDDFHKRGAGAVYIHYAVDGGKDPAGVAERMGLAFTLGSKFRHGDFDLVFEKEHPITRNFPTLHFTDETYWNMRGDTSRLTILGNAQEDNAPRPQLWVLQRNNSRIVGCIPGHYTWTFDDPLYRALLLRSICWAAKQENIDRLSELSLVGADWKP